MLSEDKLATLTDRMQVLGIANDAFPKNSVGALLAKAYRLAHDGQDPPTPYDRKASGLGSHNLTAYPESFWPAMDQIILTCLERSAESLRRAAPMPRDVSEALLRKGVKDVTPASGEHWWG